jgi:two-component system, OmpR family, sensor histidine kinase BaeS
MVLTSFVCVITVEPDGAAISSLHDKAILPGSLIDDLQDLALADAGKLVLDRRPVAICDLISEAVRSVSAEAREKQIDLKIEPGPGLPLVKADARRVSQVLRNLLANAIDHTPRCGRVTISSRRVDGAAGITVHDTGGGSRRIIQHLSLSVRPGHNRSALF